MNPTITERTRSARLAAIALARAVLHGDEVAYDVMLPESVTEFEESYYALLGLTYNILSNVDRADDLLDALTGLNVSNTTGPLSEGPGDE